MPNLSAVIITFNEEKNIERCLQSLQGIVDEIVVIDSYSTDNTELICKNYGAKFFQQKFVDYSSQKNFANEQAQYAHILSIDADEELSEELKKSILNVKNNWQSDAYTFNRLNSYCGHWIHHSTWYPDVKLRIWDKRKGQWEGAVHEKLVMQADTKVKHLKGDLLHYTYRTVKDHVDVSYRYADMAAKEMLQKGKKIGIIKLYLSPLFKFIKIFILNKGFLDGIFGFMIAATAAFFTFLKYALVRFYRENK